MSLSAIADAINKKVPQVTASVVTDGANYYLSVSRNSTGYATSDADPSDALKLVGTDPGFSFAPLQSAQNASLKVDNLQITSQSNTITGAITGVTLNLTGQSNVATNVTFASDSSSSASSINNFINAYNAVATALNAQLRPDPSLAATNNPLAGSFLLGLEGDMQGLLSQSLGGAGAVQSLSDLNVSLQDDGTLVLDQLPHQKTFAQAIAADPGDANKLFTTAKTGITAMVDSSGGQANRSGHRGHGGGNPGTEQQHQFAGRHHWLLANLSDQRTDPVDLRVQRHGINGRHAQHHRQLPEPALLQQ
jgi:flagellar hook-associated protein 2